jgi:tetratricopeptide (TPR) repeat protein
MVLGWSGISVAPDKLAPEVFTPSRKGSLQSAIIAAARRHGRIAYVVSAPEALLEEVGAGHPTIVLQDLGFSWKPAWHYAVAIGYDLNQDLVILHSGVTPRKRLSLRAFHKTWAGSEYWGLLVLPPTRMPVTATEESYISAVLGLELAGQWGAAVEGYKTALDRWPDSLGARMGLGNSYYASGDKESAEAAFREATRRFPTDGSAYNNLAQVLWEQGEQADAVKAARRAVELGGPLADVYRETLEEIEGSLQPR